MVISFSISAAPTITNKIAIVLYKADNPNTIYASQEFDPPHTSPRNINFTDVEPVVYIVNTYETSGLPTLGILRHSWQYNPEFADLEIKVQYLTFNEGDVTYDVPDTSWNGYKVLYIDRRGTGSQILTRITDTEPRPDATIRVRDADADNPKGFDLIAEGDAAFQDELFVVTLITRMVSRLPIYQVAKIIRDSKLLTNDSTVTSEDANKDIILAGDSGVGAFTVSLPAIGSFDNFATFFFNSNGGAHVNVTLDAGTDKIFIYNPNGTGYRNKVHLAQQEQFAVYNNADGWHIVHNCTGILHVGEHVEGYTRNFMGCIFMDGSTRLRNVERRLWEYFNSADFNGAIVADGQWLGTSLNLKAYPSNGDNSTTFRLPQVYSAGFAEPVPAVGRSAANFQPHAMEKHQHISGADSDATGANTSPFGVSPLPTTARIGKYSGTFTSIPDMTGDAYVLSGGIFVPASTGTKTRPDSYGVYKSIRR